MMQEKLSPGTILIIGGGPVGSILAVTLAHHGVPSVLLERNPTTTRWPKMDLTTARSMEIYRRLGICDDLRQLSVPSRYSFNCLFSSGLHADTAISSWQLPSVDEYRKRIATCNDGTMPLEPWVRVSQEVFEAWLKRLAEANGLIDYRAEWKVTGARELEEGAEVTVINGQTGEESVLQADYAVGCDGAHSVLRESLGIELEGGPIPARALLVHFKSKDLSRIQKQGQFWHLFMLNAASDGGGLKGAVIAQDEIDTWTVHHFLRPDDNPEEISAEDAVYRVLGGMGEHYPIEIDEILVRSTWVPSQAVAQAYAGPRLRMFLAGDACHQMVPTGGYGMNSGIGDAYDLGWKLAARVKGWGGPQLLSSYEEERRPVAELALKWAKVHMGNLMHLSSTLGLAGDVIQSKSAEGEKMRAAVHEYLQTHDGHNQSIGVEMAYRYRSSITVLDDVSHPPEFDPRRYQPTTCPGYRAPHVCLSGGTPIFDHLGKDFTLVVFSHASDPESVSQSVEYFRIAAEQQALPLRVVELMDEDTAHRIWSASLVLVRPDEFVSWRGDEVLSQAAAQEIIRCTTGWGSPDGSKTKN